MNTFLQSPSADGNVSSSGDCLPKRQTYKRACERPAALVARRNARERGRVQMVNGAFERLRRHLPYLKLRQKRVAKLKILRAAIDYIYDLQDELESNDISNLKQTRTQAETSASAPNKPNTTTRQPPPPLHQATFIRPPPTEFQLLQPHQHPHDYEMFIDPHKNPLDCLGSYQTATLPLCSSSCIYKPETSLLLAHYNTRFC